MKNDNGNRGLSPVITDSKYRKPFLFLCGLAILAGLFIYFVTRERPLSPNAVHRDGMYYIALGESITDEEVRRQASFVVPDKYKVSVSDAGIAFHIRYPDGAPYTGNESPVPEDGIRIAISYHTKPNVSRAERAFARVQPKDGPLNSYPWFVERKWGMDIYKSRLLGEKTAKNTKETIRTHFGFPSIDGDIVVVNDFGDWSWSYEVDRALNSHVEVIYLVKKSQIRKDEHMVEDISAVDKLVMDLIHSFQP